MPTHNAAADTIFSNAGDAILNIFGVACTYTKSDSTTIELTGLWRDENEFQLDGYTASAYKGVKVFEIKLDDAEKEPDPGETFLIGGVTYTVYGTAANDGYYATLWIK